MMDQTLYLTGYTKGHYKALMDPLREQRINDMKKLLKKLRIEAGHLEIGSKEYLSIQKRYVKIEEGILFWRNL